MKPHIKVIQRKGVDIFVTSSMVMKPSKSERESCQNLYGVPNRLRRNDFMLNPVLLQHALRQPSSLNNVKGSVTSYGNGWTLNSVERAFFPREQYLINRSTGERVNIKQKSPN